MKNVVLLLLLLPSCLFAQRADSIRIAMDNYDYGQVLLLTETNSSDLKMALMRAQALRALNRTKEAIAAFQNVLELDSTNIQSIAGLAECYKTSGNIIKATQSYAKLFELQPENPFFQLQYFNSLTNLEEYDRAIDLCHEIISNDSTALSYRLLGQAYQQKKDISNAFLAYNIAYRKDSSDYITVSNIASIFNDNKQYDDAIGITEKFRLADTTNIAVNRQNAKAYCMKNDYKTAIERYESLKYLGDRSFTTLYYLGVSYYGDQWFYGAYDNLKLAVQKAPNDLNILYYLGLSAVRTSWKNEGVDYLQTAIGLATPDDSLMVKLYKGLADCYRYVNDNKSYVDAMLTVYKKYTPSDDMILFRIADYFDRSLLDPKTAIKYYEKYMSAVPKEKQQAQQSGDGSLTYYQFARKRVEKLKEELFFKEGKE